VRANLLTFTLIYWRLWAFVWAFLEQICLWAEAGSRTAVGWRAPSHIKLGRSRERETRSGTAEDRQNCPERDKSGRAGNHWAVLPAHRGLAAKTIAVLFTLCHERASPTTSRLGTNVFYERQQLR
jgi:hypothetical protein